MTSFKHIGRVKAICLILITGIIYLSCDQSTPSTPKEDAISVLNFPNILHLKGKPESSTDRSVYIFSDLGAWHGYALPSDNEKSLMTSFVGPFLMTQDNGVWLSESLSKLEIIDLRTEQALDMEKINVLENTSYPNELSQVVQYDEYGLRIQSQLFFVSDRTAMIRLELENLNAEGQMDLSLRFKGKSMMEGVAFSKASNGINISFDKNDNMGLISTSDSFKATTDTHSYSLQLPKVSLKAGKKWETSLCHTFCFSEQELTQESSIVAEAMKTPSSTRSLSENRWNTTIQNTIHQIKPEFSSQDHQAIAVKCLQTLNTNWRSAAGQLEHDGLFPSYNYKWFHGLWSWDSWKHAVALSYFDTDLAQNQIKAMFDFQDEHGMIADCVYRDNVLEENNWRDTKPPLSAWSVWEVYSKSEDMGFLSELYPKLKKYHDWWYQFRDINQNGLCEYGSTDGTLVAAKWESGMDNAVRFDSAQIIKNDKVGGSLNIESVDLNAYLYAEKQYLSRIAEVLNHPEDAARYKKHAQELKNKISERFYSEAQGWFFDYNLATESHLEIYGSEGWTPLWTGLATADQAAKARLKMIDSTMFATHIPFPTLDASHPKFSPQNGYWRGPVWIDQAYFAIKGLQNYGYEEDAQKYTHHLFDRLDGLKNSNKPIRENYNPLTGEGLESQHFSWSAAHLLMLLIED